MLCDVQQCWLAIFLSSGEPRRRSPCSFTLSLNTLIRNRSATSEAVMTINTLQCALCMLSMLASSTHAHSTQHDCPPLSGCTLHLSLLCVTACGVFVATVLAAASFHWKLIVANTVHYTLKITAALLH
jgi:hypothetical protein